MNGAGIHDLGFLRDDQILAARQRVPFGILRQRGAHRRTLVQIVIGIDVDDLVERTEFGVPESSQF